MFIGSLPYGIFNISTMVNVNMRSNSLSGEMPNDVCSNENPKLKRIILNNNQLLGSIPPNIGNCRELEEIWLNDNNISGSIPLEIGGLSKLEFLSLSTNGLTGMAVFLLECVIFRIN